MVPHAFEAELLAVLGRARDVGFLGPGPLEAHIEHAQCFLAAIPDHASTLLDLGSGGGIPGLPILLARPEMAGTLLDAAARRGAFLQWAAVELGIINRVTVVVGRAESLAHRPDLRAQFAVVVSRGFGPPAVTVENARGFLAEGGRLIISEPPEGRGWPETVLNELSLRPVRGHDRVAVFESTGHAPDEVPRPLHRQRRRPLF